MILPLEDNVGDVLSKAQKGLGISTEMLAERSGVSEVATRALRRGDYDAESAMRVAATLDLRLEAVALLGEGRWRPRPVPAMEGFRAFPTPFYEGWALAYLVWDARSGRAVAVDAGTNAAAMTAFARDQGLELEAALLTHAHVDHVGGLDALMQAGARTVLVSGLERKAPTGSKTIEEGYTYELGSVRLRAMSTPGHTAGGVTYIVDGLERPLAVVGDALFAGSMGGANTSYQKALDSLGLILGLPGETILAPGHGPMTTVSEELKANCFWRG